MSDTPFPTVDFEAGGKRWRITALGSRAGLGMLVKLGALLGPAIAQLGEKGGAASATVALFARLTDAAAQEMVAAFLRVTEVEREHGFVRHEKLDKLAQEQLFAADFGTLFEVVAQHVELNFSSFLGAVGRTVPRAPAAAAEAEPESSEQ